MGSDQSIQHFSTGTVLAALLGELGARLPAAKLSDILEQTGRGERLICQYLVRRPAKGARRARSVP